MEAVLRAGTMRTMTGRRSRTPDAPRQRFTALAKISFLLDAVYICAGIAIIGAIILNTQSIPTRTALLLSALVVLLPMLHTIIFVTTFQRRALAIVPGHTPHCLRCGYPADVPAPRCPECGVVRTDRTVVLGTPRFLPADTAKALWGMILFGAVLVAGMVVWAMRF